MNASERGQLIDDLLAGDISEADFLRIEAEMSVDASVRQEFYRRLQLDQLLQCEADHQTAALRASTPVQDEVTRWNMPRWIGVLAVIAAAWLAIVFLTRPSSSMEEDLAGESFDAQLISSEQSARGFGLLAGQSQAVWVGDPVATGSLLTDRNMRLKSGLVRLEFFSGVDMVIEGEADFRVDSPMQLTLRRGKARARVPEPAQGFRVKTTMGDVVDLGTEFSIDADVETAEVQVVEGEIELHPRHDHRSGTETPKLIEPGTTVSWSVDGSFAERDDQDAEAVAKIGPNEFQELAERRHRKKMIRYHEHCEQLCRDDRLIAFYQVDPNADGARRLANQSLAPRQLASEGAVVATGRTADRWNREGGALSFSPMGSRIRVNVPGEYRGLSLFCWVKIDRLDRLYNSLFLTDGHEDREPHWQIMADGRLFFSVKRPLTPSESASEESQKIFFSPPVFDSKYLGQWIMLGVTYDIEKKSVTHYVNGHAVSSETIAEPFLVESIRIGAASIGNWSEPMYRTDPTFVVRNLNGCLDEFAIFEDVLAAEEIQRIFELGTPNE